MERIKYRRVFTPIHSSLYTVQDFNFQWGVVDEDDNVIVEFGKYRWIDGFQNGFAKVVSYNDNVASSWEAIDEEACAEQGVIDESGKVVVPLKYNVWKFYGKSYPSVIIEDNGVRHHLSLQDMRVIERPDRMASINVYDEDYGTHFGDYEGSYAQDEMGYSDDVINDAFDGDPEAYWNID